jgi:hypothetical protein
MSFPRLAVPEDTIKLVSRTKPVRIRPYLVGEEKIMLIAQQAVEQDPESKEVEKAVKQIIGRCTFGEVDPDTLPIFDVEWLFLQLRAKSVNNVIDAQFRCVTMTPAGTKCDTLVPISIDINDIKMTIPEGHSNKVMLDDTTGIILKYPTAPTASDDTIEALCNCLDNVFLTTGDVFEAKDQTPAEVRAFVEALTLPQVERIRTTFFDTMPRLSHTFAFTCPKCGHSEDITLEGLTSFFD